MSKIYKVSVLVDVIMSATDKDVAQNTIENTIKKCVPVEDMEVIGIVECR